ncbi:hypothetical protein ILUMI_16084 [Ignelater luminosus]|uniref:Reverse transcriptase domain-containing protein n=1 Tax=Ignelater luminosus TaxID=2038154 RepID=A0A8K0CP92_IGNLU|nr:hypothetical protein ILUMI_16084 [Ignelater luminosus]
MYETVKARIHKAAFEALDKNSNPELELDKYKKLEEALYGASHRIHVNDDKRAAPTILYDILARLFNKCLKGEMIPEEWKKATITSIYKEGNRQDCNKYREICVMPSPARMYGGIFKQRIEMQITESEKQNGFRLGRSCIYGICTLKNLMEKRVTRGISTHLVFVDLYKAYDTVPQSKLWIKEQETEIDDMKIKTNAIKGYKAFKCLGVNLSSRGKSVDDIINKIGQDKKNNTSTELGAMEQKYN